MERRVTKGRASWSMCRETMEVRRTSEKGR